MKKLMIAAAVATIGMVACAATVNWSGNQAMIDGTVDQWLGGEEVTLGQSGWQVLIFDSNFTQGTLGEAGYVETSFTTIQAALAAGDKTALGDLFAYKVGAGRTAAEGAFAVEADMSVDVNNKVKGFAVILDAEDLEHANYAFLLQEQSKTKGAAGTMVEVNNIDQTISDYNGYLDMSTYRNGEGSGANWYAVGTAAPEPTSGLLLLLGVAGLALKRKRA